MSHQVPNVVEEVEPGEQEASPVEEYTPNFIDVATVWLKGFFSRRYPAQHPHTRTAHSPPFPRPLTPPSPSLTSLPPFCPHPRLPLSCLSLSSSTVTSDFLSTVVLTPFASTPTHLECYSPLTRSAVWQELG